MAFETQSTATNSSFSSSKTQGMASLACGPTMRIIGIIAIVFLTTHSAFGQFLVNPATIRKTLSPGRRETLVTSLNNMIEETQAVDLRLIDLTLGTDGTWQIIEPDDPNADRSTLKSCRSWLKKGPLPLLCSA